ncbi:MAG: hypothetical protein AAB636_00480 [Patescibacteria group bacterium]
MDNIQSLNFNNNYYSDQNLLFDTNFLNIEYFFNKVYLFFRQFFGLSSSPDTGTNFFYTFAFVGDIFETIFYFLIILLIIITAYCIVRLFEIRKKEHQHLKHEIEEYAHHQKEREKNLSRGEDSGRPRNEKWEKILQYLFSDTEADWKLSIIDADEMLFLLMDQLSFKGESLGDKLKAADRDKFRNLSTAWEVHTVRNRIAHEGTNYQLSQREAKRVIALYEQIFREFGYI